MLQVRVFYQKCGDLAQCNCGAAVRVDENIILLTSCVPGEAIRVQMLKDGELQSGLIVRRYDGGDRFEVWNFISN